MSKKFLFKITPQTRIGDNFIAFLKFTIRHKRFPTKNAIFNDVLYAIKTTDEILNPLRVFVSDKEFVKLYIKAVAGDQYNILTIAVLRTMEEVKKFDFPSECVIKPTHACGQFIIRRNGEPINLGLIEGWFELNYYRASREANYKLLKPKVIVEPYVFSPKTIEYRFFCLNGVPKLIKTNIDRVNDLKINLFDINWNELDVSTKYPRHTNAIHRPKLLDQMLALSALLSQGFSFVRIDLYSDDERIFAGEITHCDNGASGTFIPASGETIISDLIFG